MPRSRIPPEPHMSPRPDLGPKPRLGYTENPLARVSERRSDPAFVDEVAAGDRAGAYAIGGEMVVLRKAAAGHDPLFRLPEARALGPAQETVFLGLLDGAG